MSHPRTIIEQLISKLASFASTFLASDKCVGTFLRISEYLKIDLNLLKICLTAYGMILNN
jgi:hypothetical protein